MSIVSRIKSLVTKAEGSTTAGPWWLPVTGGFLGTDAGSTWNWWQRGYDVDSYSPSSLVEACVGAYSQTVAMCPGDHWWRESVSKGRERVTTSALSRVLKKPNAYQSRSDFLLDATRDLYVNGNAYALAIRNDRYEISELHLMNPRQSAPMIAYNGDIFYSLGGNEVIERQTDYPLMVPARDVLHLRLRTKDSNMLIGESPMVAAARDIMASDAMTGQQIAYYLNQARPSTVLTTDMVLDAAQTAALRERWNEQSRGINSGGTPILTAGLKPVQLSFNAVDSQLAEIMKANEQRIALAFRVPLQILGIGGAVGSTEALMQSWIATGLGFCLNHIEESIGNLFGLKGYPDEYVEFDTSALLRSSRKEQVELLARGVQSGIFSPNEARAEFELLEVQYGDEPRVQAQVVPLSAAQGIPSAPSAQASPASPSGLAGPIPEVGAPPSKETSDDAIAKWARNFIHKANRIERYHS